MDSEPATRDEAGPDVPPIPAAALDPRPALASGTAVWAVGLIVCLVVDGTGRKAALCAVGMAVGALGWLVYSMQRRAVRRGIAGAQRGLDFDAPRDVTP